MKPPLLYLTLLAVAELLRQYLTYILLEDLPMGQQGTTPLFALGNVISLFVGRHIAFPFPSHQFLGLEADSEGRVLCPTVASIRCRQGLCC